ncbi:hypothetical protein PYW07_010437 [Mythimna separata]|uniref:Odorant receptor n=1 Tax=Mythimna separata TaxID=271217 RepID=A0AAD8DLG9_MYTSE|nr:hypothetical protein PYW07_010437 [Mythimna separata]
MSGKEFEKTLKLTKYALLISGIKTSENPVNKTVDYFVDHYLYYCNFIALYTVLIGEAYWIVDGIQNGTPFIEISLISPCITISVLSTVKSWFIYLNKEILIRVVSKLKDIHPNFDENEAEKSVGIAIERKIIKKSMKLLNSVQVLLLSIYVLVVTAFCLIPVMLSGYNYHKTGEFVVIYPYYVKYPFDVYHSSVWYLIYIHQVWATVIVIFFVFGCDTLFFALCVYINMHFHLLGLRFENIVSKSKHETERNLRKAIVRHQELIDLVDQSELLFTKSSLFNIVMSSILICLSAFNITVANLMADVIAFITFLLMSLSQISMVCYFGDLLMNSSVEINKFIYNCPWYEADADSKRTLFLVMMRSQKACRLTAWKFAVLNLGAFTTILSRSWSYFALLKTVYK